MDHISMEEFPSATAWGQGLGLRRNTEGAPVAESVLLYQTLLSHSILTGSADSHTYRSVLHKIGVSRNVSSYRSAPQDNVDDDEKVRWEDWVCD